MTSLKIDIQAAWNNVILYIIFISSVIFMSSIYFSPNYVNISDRNVLSLRLLLYYSASISDWRNCLFRENCWHVPFYTENRVMTNSKNGALSWVKETCIGFLILILNVNFNLVPIFLKDFPAVSFRLFSALVSRMSLQLCSSPVAIFQHS